MPVFGYGEDICSTAAVESSFKKLKLITFKNISLPTNIDEFLENHISSNRGASLINSTTYITPLTNKNLIKQNTANLECPNEFSDESSDEDDFLLVQEKCPLCNSGSLHLKNGAHVLYL